MDAVVEGTFVSDPLGQGPPAETLLPTFVDARPRSIVVAALGDVSLPSHLATPNRVPLKSLQHFNRQCFIATNSLSFSPDPFTDPLLQLQTTSRPFLSITATPSAALSFCPDQDIRSRSCDRLFAALGSGGLFLRSFRSIASAHDINKLELKRCLRILNACDLATDLYATLSSIKI
ncbi:hypothetical protein IWW34DRAFT_855410 [Fusarium oxysporum f. sp. albedinis]|nr:hypothetical protein IWW34DRAFT_855410 [Fusarium oxysporum f. sp. albedinis]